MCKRATNRARIITPMLKVKVRIVTNKIITLSTRYGDPKMRAAVRRNYIPRHRRLAIIRGKFNLLERFIITQVLVLPLPASIDAVACNAIAIFHIRA